MCLLVVLVCVSTIIGLPVIYEYCSLYLYSVYHYIWCLLWGLLYPLVIDYLLIIDYY